MLDLVIKSMEGSDGHRSFPGSPPLNSALLEEVKVDFCPFPQSMQLLPPTWQLGKGYPQNLKKKISGKRQRLGISA